MVSGSKSSQHLRYPVGWFLATIGKRHHQPRGTVVAGNEPGFPGRSDSRTGAGNRSQERPPPQHEKAPVEGGMTTGDGGPLRQSVSYTGDRCVTAEMKMITDSIGLCPPFPCPFCGH
jgi:hypothetical protein